jgi:hypothetical protein
MSITTVKINSSDQSLKGISRDETIVRVIDVSRLYELYQPSLLSYTVEAATLHYFATYGGEKSLFLSGKMMKQDVAHYSFNDGIA